MTQAIFKEQFINHTSLSKAHTSLHIPEIPRLVIIQTIFSYKRKMSLYSSIRSYNVRLMFWLSIHLWEMLKHMEQRWWNELSFTECTLLKLTCSINYKNVAILYLKFHSNYTWNHIYKINTEYAQKAFFLFLENTLLSLLRLIFFLKESLSYWSSNDPYKLFESYSNWPLNSP